MRKKTPPKKPIIKGELVPWTDAEIDAMAEITEEDKYSALAFFDANAPKSMKGLLQAKKTAKGK